MQRLHNKVAIVTGAAGGMGASVAHLFAEQGALVLATDIQFEKMNAWVQESRKHSLAIECIRHDVGSESDWKSVVEKALHLYAKIDILINNAGVYQPMETTEATSLESWNQILQINLTEAQTMTIDLAIVNRQSGLQIAVPDPALQRAAETELPTLETALTQTVFTLRTTRCPVVQGCPISPSA